MSFKRFDPQDVIVSAESITTPVFSSNATTLNTFFTSSVQLQASSGEYFVEVYQEEFLSASAEPQFYVAYAHEKGSGSLLYNPSVDGKSRSSTIYGQYRNIALEDEDTSFQFGGVSVEDFYVISVDRARYKEKILPGSLTLNLGQGSDVISLTDNSQVVSTISFSGGSRVFEIVSGSQGTVYTGASWTGGTNGYSNASGSYGKFLPDIGVLLINADALSNAPSDGGISFSPTENSNSDDNNPEAFVDAMNIGGQFTLRSDETVSSNFIFVRARNNEFNYSTNPSISTGSGELRYDVLRTSPQAFITSVGLYNDNNDLLAVAKLSRPLLKDFTRELNLRIKLDY
jgi:hypothetical protein